MTKNITYNNIGNLKDVVSIVKGVVNYRKNYIFQLKVFRKFKPQGCWINSRGGANFKTLDSDQQQQIHFQIEV